jgi:hypothetical protein
MDSFNPQVSPVVVNNHISVKTAAKFIGYSLQYLRRLLRFGKDLKIGQVWLIDKSVFEAYLDNATQATDRRYDIRAVYYKRIPGKPALMLIIPLSLPDGKNTGPEISQGLSSFSISNSGLKWIETWTAPEQLDAF